MKTNNNSRFTILFFIAATLIALASRWLPHPDNFSAMGGLLFLCGYLVVRDRAVLPVALAALLVIDLLIGLYAGVEWVYLGYVAILALGWTSSKTRVGMVGIANAVAAVAFFVLSNIGVWLSSGLYPQTSEGLRQCFLMALPFFHMTFVSQVLVGVGLVLVYTKMAAAAEVKQKA
ncbi:MAG: DUF6580 family putative transport protein [Bdellovibrionota bacterium]